MGRLKFWAASLLFGLAAGAGCSKPPVPTAEGPALWRLTDEDSEIWLFGTVHVLPPDLKWRSARIDQAFRAADTVYFETPTDAEASVEIGLMVRNHGLNPPGVTLSSQLDAETNARLKRVCAALNIDPATLEPEKPWLAALQLSVAFIVKNGQQPDSGVERVLDAEAKTLNKKRVYFETAEQQIRFFADLPDEVNADFLKATLRQIEEEGDVVDEMDQAWVSGDVETLSGYLNDMLHEAGPEVYKALIVDRNARWADEIDTIMQGSGKTFIAVGAAHLAGEDSLAVMLRKKGYKVEGP